MIRPLILFILLIFLVGTARAQSRPSKETFVNAIFETIVDSSWSSYNLAVEASPCSFVKFDYDEWVKYALMENVPIWILYELAKNSYEDRKAPSNWEDEKLIKATCIAMTRADTILTRLTTILQQHRKDWSRLPPEQKEVFYFSRPVFTDDNSYAIIDLSYRCDIRECGMGATYLFRQTAAGWKLLGRMLRWGT